MRKIDEFYPLIGKLVVEFQEVDMLLNLLLGLLLKEDINVTMAFAVSVPFGKKINQIFHFDWIYQILAFFLRIQSKIVYGFTLVLEGEGGILWALVFLALLVSLLVNGGAGL